jgi:hypothetical protein
MPITVSGTQITFNDATTQTTAFTGSTGVTSVATGNGLSGGTITSTGTLVVACPGANTVGSYICAHSANTNMSFGSNYGVGNPGIMLATNGGSLTTSGISGTWKWLGTGGEGTTAIACRVS